MQVKSKYSYGRGTLSGASDADVDLFFASLAVPKSWKLRGKANIIDAEGKVLSKGYVFRDMNTTGYDLKDYRIWVLISSGKGGITEKTVSEVDSKPVYKCVIDNKVVGEINEYIKSRYDET